MDSQYDHIILPQPSGSVGGGSPEGLWAWPQHTHPSLHPNPGLGKDGAVDARRLTFLFVTKRAKNLSR